MTGGIIVLKFGSSVLHSQTQLPTAVHEIYRWYRAGWRVVAIVSAIGDATEALLRTARDIADPPEPDATAQLLATGERHSAALLGLALDRSGIKSRVVDPREIGLTTIGSALDSEPVAVDRACVEQLLRKSAVIVVPGFFGYAENGQLQLLGRGGSDLSAVYLANAIGASRCRLLKDVDGVYERDPALTASTPSRRFVSMGYAEALERAGQLIQPKAVRFIDQHSASAEVAAIAMPYESSVGRLDRRLIESQKAAPLSVLLLGLGTVGLGVYQRLTAMPEHFQVIGALVRDRAKHVAAGIPEELLHDSQEVLAHLRADVVVDALPGLQPSRSLARYYLAHGAHVVSANKALIAEAGIEFSALATRNAASLRYSAAVGGAVPMLEALDLATLRGEIRSIAGVLNGTCNYVLDQCVAGMSLDDAVRAAQACGFAEADASEDLSGRDAARKLRILARAAFGQDLVELEIQPLDDATLTRSQRALRSGETLRLIARAWRADSQVLGQLQLETVPADDAFAQTREEWNRLVITCADGEPIVVSGRGAGRWPTTEAVMADLFAVHRDYIEENEDARCGSPHPNPLPPGEGV